MADGSWQTDAFRNNVVEKIDEAIRQSCKKPSRTSIEMENDIFQKAKNKDEYLGYVEGIILLIRKRMSSLSSSFGANIKVTEIGASSKSGGHGSKSGSDLKMSGKNA